MEIRPIRNEDDHKAALVEIDRLWGAPVGSADGDRLDVLAALVEHFERVRWPSKVGPPVEILKFMMDQNGRSQSDLAHLLGSRSRASEILHGKRELTLEHIRILSREWHIPAGALIGELVAA